jgi:DNA-directed RNA polymerase subunit alpha
VVCERYGLIISVKTLKRLKSAGIETVEDIVRIKEGDLLNFNNLNNRSYEKIKKN